jgi:hypothetical protein
MIREYIIKIDEDKTEIMGNCPLVEKPQELVRCKYCKYSHSLHTKSSTGVEQYYCMNLCATVGENAFCADGKRSEQE